MTDTCCSCLLWACPELRVQSKSLHEAAVLSGCLTSLSDKEAVPSQRGALGLVLFHLVLCMDKEDRRVFGKGLPGHGGAVPQHTAGGRSIVYVRPGCRCDKDVLFRQLHSMQAFGQDL